MSSIDCKRIVGKSDEELDELICGICHDVYEEPVVTKCCRQMYCCVCINQWLKDNNTCPDNTNNLNSLDLIPAPLFVVNLINKMYIKCEYYLNGCEVITTVGEIKNHIKTCNKRSVLKCNSCEESKKVITNYEKEIKELKVTLKKTNDQVQTLQNEEQNKIKKLKTTNDSLINQLKIFEMSEEELIIIARSHKPTIDDVKNEDMSSKAMVESFLNITTNVVNNSKIKQFHEIADQIKDKLKKSWNDFDFIVYVLTGCNCGVSDLPGHEMTFQVKFGPLCIQVWEIKKE